MQTVIKSIKGFLKKHDRLRLLARKIAYNFKQIIYRINSVKFRINEKTILFESFMGRQYSCNPRAIYEEIIKDDRFNDYELVWTFRATEDKAGIEDLKRAKLIEYKSKEYYEYCAKAGFIVTNSNLIFSFVRRRGQVVIQTWHGTPLKRLRCDIEAKSGNANNSLTEIQWKNDMDIIRYNYFISPSDFCTRKFTTAFRLDKLELEDILIETGYPRNDFLVNYTDKNVERIKKSLGIEDNDKKIILYAPTFRDNQHETGVGYVYKTEVDFDKLQNALGDEYIMLFRPHYFVANQFDFDKYKGFIYDVTKVDDIKELYVVSDVLMTDYSSVFFDYAVLERPVIFYMYDLEEYAGDIRGFYLDVNELPGNIVTDEDSLIREIKSLGEWSADEKYKKFNAKFTYLDDGNASNRVLERCILNNAAK